MYDEYIDRLTQYFTQDRFKESLTVRKQEFFDEAGIVDEENHSFEMRMNQFLEWYLFTKPLDEIGLTPAQYALQLDDFEMSAPERPAFENLAVTRHSLYEFLKIQGNDVFIRDLYNNKKYLIRNSPICIGFNRDEIFDGRLIPDGEDFHFSRAFCFHPVEASKFILSEIKKQKKLKDESVYEDLMLRLLKMRYKYEQYRHLKLDYVYTNEKKVRF